MPPGQPDGATTAGLAARCRACPVSTGIQASTPTTASSDHEPSAACHEPSQPSSGTDSADDAPAPPIIASM